MEFDVAVVGAGPAGLFAAYELVMRSGDKLRIAVIDRGARASERVCPMHASSLREPEKPAPCAKCAPCRMMHGVGGAGLISSGAFNLRPDVGGDIDKLIGSFVAAERLISYVDSILVKLGAPEDSLVLPSEEVSELERLVAKTGAKFVPTPQRVLGSEGTLKVTENMHSFLEKAGVKFFLNTFVARVRSSGRAFLLETNSGTIAARFVLLAPGRSGAAWFSAIARELGIEVEPGPLDVGIRVEIPSYVAERVTNVVRDPKIIMYTRAYDDKVRTFCTNPNGFVVQEVYNNEMVAVNGVSYRGLKSANTNMALLVTVKLTDPLEDTIAYGKSIAMLATKLGGGKPIVQRLGDLLSGRRSTWSRISRSNVEPTLKNVTPGDVTMALPHRIVSNLLESIERLDDVMPGLYSGSTLIYAPEMKFYSVRAVVSKKLETTVENVFVAGDGAGLSRGLNGAAATGVLAARGILEKLT
ncbi:MAG: NAD(P)/FAD-dependent oxidoreductase [Fervidicoccaceae archaeon]